MPDVSDMVLHSRRVATMIVLTEVYMSIVKNKKPGNTQMRTKCACFPAHRGIAFPRGHQGNGVLKSSAQPYE